MASYTINTTARQDKGIAWYLAKVNAERASRTPPLAAVTELQLARNRIAEMFEDWAAQAEDETRNTSEHIAVREAYLAADSATKDQVKTILGVS